MSLNGRRQRLGEGFTLAGDHEARKKVRDSLSTQNCIHLCFVHFNLICLINTQCFASTKVKEGGIAHASLAFFAHEALSFSEKSFTVSPISVLQY